MVGHRWKMHAAVQKVLRPHARADRLKHHGSALNYGQKRGFSGVAKFGAAPTGSLHPPKTAKPA